MIQFLVAYARFSPTIPSTGLESAAQRLFLASDEIIRSQYAARYPLLPVYVSVRIEQASTRVWVQATTTAAALIALIGNYGDFRDGVNHIVEDAQSIAKIIVRHLPAALGVSQERPETHRTRPGVPGELRRLFSQVERGQLSAEEATRRALAHLTRHGDQLPPEFVDQLKRELEATESLGEPSGRELIEAEPGPPRRPKHRSPAIARPVRLRVRRRGVVATRDEDTGQIRLRSYEIGD